jgi:hypothetical protein
MANTTQYMGKAGQLAVMSEFAYRGYNVAMPEIDIGDDIFVVNDDNGNMWRIQVKTSRPYPHKNTTGWQFGAKWSAVATAKLPGVFFIFAMRRNNVSGWRYAIFS